MIDYEKLKQAHELTKLYSKIYEHLSGINMIFDDERCIRIEFENKHTIKFSSLDELIEHLLKLTQPLRKYKIDECVWFCNGSQEYSEVSIEGYTGRTMYLVLTKEGYRFNASECNLYPSLMHVINSQLTFWEQLKAVKTAEEFKKSNPSQHLLDASRYLNPHQGD